MKQHLTLAIAFAILATTGAACSSTYPTASRTTSRTHLPKPTARIASLPEPSAALPSLSTQPMEMRSVDAERRARIEALAQAIEQADNAAAAAFQAAAREQAAERASAYAQTRSAERPTTTAAEATGTTWQCIIQRESGGNPTAVNPSSGDSGLYQFSTGTWLSHGGGQYAPTAAQATPAQQTAIAIATQAQDGWRPWASDGCA